MEAHEEKDRGGDVLGEYSERQKDRNLIRVEAHIKDTHSVAQSKGEIPEEERHTSWRRQQHTVKARRGKKAQDRKVQAYICTEKHRNSQRQEIPRVEDWGMGGKHVWGERQRHTRETQGTDETNWKAEMCPIRHTQRNSDLQRQHCTKMYRCAD